MIESLRNLLWVSFEAHVHDVIFVALIRAVVEEVIVGVASNGGEGSSVSHSQLEEVPRAVVVAWVGSESNDRRDSVDVTAGMRRSTVREEVDVTDAVQHAEVSSIGVDDLNVSAVISVDGLEVVDPVVFETGS